MPLEQCQTLADLCNAGGVCRGWKAEVKSDGWMTWCLRTVICTRVRTRCALTVWSGAKGRCHVDSDPPARFLDSAMPPAPPPPPAGHPLITLNCSPRATNSTRNLFSRSPGLPTMVKLPVTTWAQNGTLMHRKCPRQHPQRYFLSYVCFYLWIEVWIESIGTLAACGPYGPSQMPWNWTQQPQVGLFYQLWMLGQRTRLWKYGNWYVNHKH
jgi:hypothetical protein